MFGKYLIRPSRLAPPGDQKETEMRQRAVNALTDQQKEDTKKGEKKCKGKAE